MKSVVKQAYDFLATPILIINQVGTIDYINQAAQDILAPLNQDSDYFSYLKDNARCMTVNNKVITALKSLLARKKASFTFNQFLLNDNKKELFTVKAVSFPKQNEKIILTYESLELEKENFYQLLSNNSLEGFALHKMLFDQDNNPVDYIFLDFNQTFEELTNLKAENIIGQRASEVIPGLEETGFIELYGEAVLNDKMHRFTRYSKPLSRYYEISVLPLPGDKFITNFVDITEKKKVESKLKLNKSLIDNAPIGIFRLNPTIDAPEGKFEYANDKICELLGYNQNELVGKQVTDIDSKYSVEGLKQLKQKIEEKRFLKVESLLETKNGSTFPAEIITRYVKYQDEKYGVAFIHDISKRKEQERKLKEKNKLLEQQFAKGEKIHQQLLPNGLFKAAGIEIATFYQATDKIGADFNQILELDDKIIFYISDTTGHSLDGAFVNIILREEIIKFFEQNYSAGQENILSELIKKIQYKFQVEALADDYFISLLLFVMDKESKQVRYVNAGIHITPILVQAGKSYQLKASGPPISTAIETNHYNLEEKEFVLKEDSTLLLTTDGLIEEKGNGEIYGLNRLENLAKENYKLPAEILLELIKEDAREFLANGQSFSDDLTLMIATNQAIVDKLSLQIPSDFRKLEEVKTKVSNFISNYSQEAIELLIGLQEIVANSIEHGNNQNPNAIVEIIISITSGYIIIELKDEGKGFNWSERIDKKFSLANSNETGRGIPLAKKIFDHFSYNQAGNKAILYKER